MSDVTTGGSPAGTPQDPEWPPPAPTEEGIPLAVDSGSLNKAEIMKRFGFHAAAIEGPGATREDHANLREAFMNFSGFLSINTPKSREAEIMWERLEEASMWAHKALAQTNPIDPEA